MPRHVGHITGWLWLEGTSSSPSPLLKQGWLPRSMSRLQSQTLEVAGFSGGRREDFSEDAPTGWQKMPFCIMKQRAGGDRGWSRNGFWPQGNIWVPQKWGLPQGRPRIVQNPISAVSSVPTELS